MLQTVSVMVIAVCQVVLVVGALWVLWTRWQAIREFRKFLRHAGTELEPLLQGLKHSAKFFELLGNAGDKLAGAQVLGWGFLLKALGNKLFKK